MPFPIPKNKDLIYQLIYDWYDSSIWCLIELKDRERAEKEYKIASLMSMKYFSLPSKIINISSKAYNLLYNG